MIQRLKDWFHHDDQEIFRLEWRKAARWLTNPRGAVRLFLLLYLGVVFFPVIRTLLYAMASPDGPQSAAFRTYVGLLSRGINTIQAPFLILLGIWIYAILKFTVEPFSRGRAHEIRLTMLTGREIWPAFLAGPILTLGVLMAAKLAAGFTLGAVNILTILADIRDLNEIPILAMRVAEVVLFYGLLSTMDAVMRLLAYVAITAFAVQGALPKGGSLIRLLLWMFPGFAITLGPIYILGTIIATPVLPGALRANWILFIFTVFLFLVCILISYLLLRWSLRKLRSEKFWQRMLARQENQG